MSVQRPFEFGPLKCPEDYRTEHVEVVFFGLCWLRLLKFSTNDGEYLEEPDRSIEEARSDHRDGDSYVHWNRILVGDSRDRRGVTV